MVALAQQQLPTVANDLSTQHEVDTSSLDLRDLSLLSREQFLSHDDSRSMNHVVGNGTKRAVNGTSVHAVALKQVKHVACIGAGYVGGTTCAVIANNCPWLRVTVVDLNANRINAWNSENLPIYEPDLYEHVSASRDGVPGKREANLFFSTDVDGAIDAADLIFLAVNTPTKSEGIGAGLALDIGHLESAVRKIASLSRSTKIVVEKSTAPCRTAEYIREILNTNGKPGVQFHVLSNPEFLAEGTAISDLLNPDRILIGSVRGDELEHRAAEFLVSIYTSWVPRHRIITTNLWSSELAKMAANAFLAQRISSINTISSICEATGADVTEVSQAIGLDKRIGPRFLSSSVGFGGSCFQKDVRGLAYLAHSLHLPEVAAYWDQVWQINDWQKQRFSKRIAACLYNTMVNKKIAVFGFAYKKNTGDTRESPAIAIVNQLISERADVSIYDPLVKQEAIREELYAANVAKIVDRHVTLVQDPYTAAEGAHAVIVLTDWDEFQVTSVRQIDGGKYKTDDGKGTVDWRRIARSMTKPSFVFDGRNMLDHGLLKEMGLEVKSIGKRKL